MSQAVVAGKRLTDKILRDVGPGSVVAQGTLRNKDLPTPQGPQTPRAARGAAEEAGCRPGCTAPASASRVTRLASARVSLPLADVSAEGLPSG